MMPFDTVKCSAVFHTISHKTCMLNFSGNSVKTTTQMGKTHNCQAIILKYDFFFQHKCSVLRVTYMNYNNKHFPLGWCGSLMNSFIKHCIWSMSMLQTAEKSWQLNAHGSFKCQQICVLAKCTLNQCVTLNIPSQSSQINPFLFININLFINMLMSSWLAQWLFIHFDCIFFKAAIWWIIIILRYISGSM